MEKRFLISLLLCVLVLTFYPYYLKQITPEGQQMTEETPVVSERDTFVPEQPAAVQKKLAIENQSKAESFTLQSEDLIVRLTNLGGSVEKIELTDYFDKKTQEPIHLLRDDYGTKSFGLILDRKLDLKDELFEVTQQTDTSAQFRLQVGNYEIVKTYALGENYLFNLDVQIRNLSPDREISGAYEFYFDGDSSFTDRYDERFRKVSILKDKDSVKSFGFGKVKKKGALIEGPSLWASVQKKYFSLFVKPNFELDHIRALADEKDELRTILKSRKRQIAPGETISNQFLVYAGPSEYKRLKSFGYEFQKIMTGGFWGTFRLLLLTMLGYFYDIFKNYGLAIVILTITIKILFIPLTHKSFSSMRKMQELQPKMKALQDQFKNDPQKLNKEVMGLYKKHKVNPLGGCFPILLQMPIFIALYHILSESVELRGAPFIWWITDLSEPDRIMALPFNIPLVNINSLNILPILMMLTMIWQQKLTPAAGQSKDQQNMMLLMSIVFGFIFYNLPSGLVLYWFLNNLLSIGQQLFTPKKPADPAVA